MKFRTFPKLPRRPAETGATVGGPWVALEKVHGAQLVVAVYDDDVRFGKRKAWLADDEPFFGWRLLRTELAAGARSLARVLGAPQTWLYTELHGGQFQGYSMPGLQPVQTGIDYAPDLRVVVFDVIVARDDDDPGEWLSDSELRRLVPDQGLLVPPRIARGPRAELAALPIPFPSRVPELHGLPTQPENLAEGLVLKPDARLSVTVRPSYKRKRSDFDDARFAGAEDWNPGILGASELRTWLPELVSEARVASARSKVGLDPVAVVDEVALDVAIDLAELFADSWEALADDDQTALIDEVRRLAHAAVA